MEQATPRITADFTGGNTVEEQIQAMLELAYKINCFVQARLNDVLVVASPMYDYNGTRRRRRATLLAKYESDLEKHLAEVRAEPVEVTPVLAKPDHPFVTHPTYTGPGCAMCGRDEAVHPTKPTKGEQQ